MRSAVAASTIVLAFCLVTVSGTDKSAPSAQKVATNHLSENVIYFLCPKYPSYQLGGLWHHYGWKHSSEVCNSSYTVCDIISSNMMIPSQCTGLNLDVCNPGSSSNPPNQCCIKIEQSAPAPTADKQAEVGDDWILLPDAQGWVYDEKPAGNTPIVLNEPPKGHGKNDKDPQPAAGKLIEVKSAGGLSLYHARVAKVWSRPGMGMQNMKQFLGYEVQPEQTNKFGTFVDKVNDTFDVVEFETATYLIVRSRE